ncbi:MAG: TraR/DksA family transcriptional regulator [Pseudomonadota bacterium]|jgi:DnaK suppressor protein
MIDNDMDHTYHPLHDPVYMSPQMKQFFQHLLQDKLQRLLQEEEHSVYTVTDEPFQHPDIIDQSTTESLRSNHYAFHQHEKQLRHQIEIALQRLACGSYGYCSVTGDPIGVKRLIAAPYVSYCLDAQEEQEEKQKLKTKMQ